MGFLDKFNDFKLLNDNISTGIEVKLLSLKSNTLKLVRLTTVSGVKDDDILLLDKCKWTNFGKGKSGVYEKKINR